MTARRAAIAEILLNDVVVSPSPLGLAQSSHPDVSHEGGKLGWTLSTPKDLPRTAMSITVTDTEEATKMTRTPG